MKIQQALFTFSIQNENRLYNDDSLNVTMTLLKVDKNKYIYISRPTSAESSSKELNLSCNLNQA